MMIKNKRILLIANTSRFFVHFMLPLIDTLRSEGNIVDVIGSGDSADLEAKCDHFYNVNMTRFPLSGTNISAYREVKKIIKSNNYDLIHAHTPVGGLLPRYYKYFNRKKVPPIIYTAHGFHFFKGSSLASWTILYPIEKVMARVTDALILINHEDYQLSLEKKLKAKNIYYIPGVGVEISQFSNLSDELNREEICSKFNLDPNKRYISFIGELNKNKNQSLLIHMMSYLKDQVPNVQLLLVGDGIETESYKKLVTDLNLNEYVKFLGYVKEKEEIVFINEIALSSSFREGLPINLVENMAAGKPIVATDCRGNRELVINDKNGFLIDFDPKVFSDRVSQLLLDSDLYAKFSSESLLLAEKYDVDIINKQYIDVYESVLYEK